ncbi:MAG: hypothetical protein WD187_03810 [Candidatus Woykebacteria bacterium]
MDKLGNVSSTQEHLDIEDVRDDVVLLKNGSATAVLQTTAVNFDLLSETEQDAMIFAFAATLNSLTYPIQILIRTKRMDISNYLLRVQEAGARTHNPNLAVQIEKYENFIKELVSRNQVLDKRFYVAVPYIGIDLSQVTSNITGLFKKRSPNISRGALLERAKVNLEPKVDHLIKQFSRIGVKTVRLNTEELVELFYDLYNPDVAREQKAALEPAEYSTPIVEPSLAPSYEEVPIEDNTSETAPEPEITTDQGSPTAVQPAQPSTGEQESGQVREGQAGIKPAAETADVPNTSGEQK